jgi:mannan endo-1,4-beta-mannosidase
MILNKGQNTIEIGGGWDWYDIDSVDLTPAKIAALQKPPVDLVDPDATPAARALKAYLVREYGTATLSGQYNPDDNNYVLTTTGKLPAIQGGDLIDYSPSRIAHGSDPKNETEKMIAAAKIRADNYVELALECAYGFN